MAALRFMPRTQGQGQGQVAGGNGAVVGPFGGRRLRRSIFRYITLVAIVTAGGASLAGIGANRSVAVDTQVQTGSTNSVPGGPAVPSTTSAALADTDTPKVHDEAHDVAPHDTKPSAPAAESVLPAPKEQSTSASSEVSVSVNSSSVSGSGSRTTVTINGKQEVVPPNSSITKTVRDEVGTTKINVTTGSSEGVGASLDVQTSTVLSGGRGGE